MNEFCLEWIRGSHTISVTAPAGSSLKNKVEKYAKSHPNEVEILARNNDGSIFAHIPVTWLKIYPPRIMSEEARRKASEHMKKIHEQYSR